MLRCLYSKSKETSIFFLFEILDNRQLTNTVKGHKKKVASNEWQKVNSFIHAIASGTCQDDDRNNELPEIISLKNDF